MFLLRYWFCSFKLDGLETDKEHGFFIIVDAHAAIVLVIVLPLKQSDPLFVGIETAHENYVLWDRDGPNYFSLRLACDLDLVFTQFGLQRNINEKSLSTRVNLERVKNALSQTDLKEDIIAAFKRRRVSLFVRFQLHVLHRHLDAVLGVGFTHSIYLN